MAAAEADVLIHPLWGMKLAVTRGRIGDVMVNAT
jgi:hypothetical protein